MDRGPIFVVLPRPWRCVARRRSRRAGGGQDRAGIESASHRKGDGASRRTLATDARRGGASVLDVLPRAQEARRRAFRNRKSERRFKQSPCCKGFIGRRNDDGSPTAGGRAMNSTAFIVARHDFQECKFVETRLPEANSLPDEALLVKVDRFAFTANNITYATLGEQLKYWQLFPAPEGFGNIPVWGFGEVIASRHPSIQIGERLFGYFPMATHLVIEAADVNKRGFRGAGGHPPRGAPRFNSFLAGRGGGGFEGLNCDHQALLRPLFMLSFLVDDFLAENHFFTARSVILSSASSKTAFGLAHLLHTQRPDIRVIGPTSAGNDDFVRSLGCYDDVVTYDQIESLPSDSPV